nr:MAG TPA: hypothetical protein [Caudoviricetes sp.]
MTTNTLPRNASTRPRMRQTNSTASPARKPRWRNETTSV